MVRGFSVTHQIYASQRRSNTNLPQPLIRPHTPPNEVSHVSEPPRPTTNPESCIVHRPRVKV